MMLSLSFLFGGDCPVWMSEASAPYQVDGLLQFCQGKVILFEEPSVPLIEVALFLAHWMSSGSIAQARMHAFYSTADSAQEAALFQIIPEGGTRYCLSWPRAPWATPWAGERQDMREAFTHFLATLEVDLRDTYDLELDNILRRFIPSLS